MKSKEYKPLDIAKGLTRFVVGNSVSGTLVALVHQNTQVSTPMQKARLYVGAYFIGQMVAEAARTSVDAKFESIEKTIHQVKGELEEGDTLVHEEITEFTPEEARKVEEFIRNLKATDGPS